MNSRFFQSLIVTLAAMTTIASTDIFLPSLPDITIYFSTTPEHIQLSITLALLGALVGAPLMGSLSDYYGRKSMLLAGMLIFFFATMGCVYAPSMVSFLAFRFLQGIGSTASFVIGWAIIQELYPKDESAKMMSWIGSIIGVSPMIAPTLGGYIHVLFGWRANFVLIASLAGLLAVLIILSRPPLAIVVKGNSPSPMTLLRNYKFIFKDRVFMLYLSFFSLLNCGLWAYLTLVPFYFETILHLSPHIFGLYLSVGPLFYMLGTFFTPILLRYVDVMQTIFLGVMFALGGSIGLLCTALFIPHSPLLITFFIGFYILGIAVVWGPSTSRALQKFEDMRGAASAVRGLFVTFFFAVGSLVGSFLNNSLILLAFFLIAIALLCCHNFRRLKVLEALN
jgi:DHA1 family bicyclomycin/chloramphenicol resistance-like MFS transporter